MTLSANPVVSVVIPVYNGADYLRQAVESALAQTSAEAEVLVVNDGSTDSGATERVALSFGDRIRYFAKPNGGVASALNLGIREMRGRYFSWLSHDDLYYPERTELLLREMEGAGRDVVLYSDWDYINKDSRVTRVTRLPHYAPAQVPYELLVQHLINGCTTLVPRRCFDAEGFFDESLRTTQDYDMWFRLLKRYDFVHVPMVLVHYRVHEGQGTATMSALHRRERDALFGALVEAMCADGSVLGAPGGPAVYLMKAADVFKHIGLHGAAGRAKRLATKAQPMRKSLLDRSYLRYRLRYTAHALITWARDAGLKI